jgi:hypothetical protein
MMGDMTIPPKAAGKFQKFDPNSIYSLRPNSKGCNTASCHGATNPTAPAGTLVFSKPESTFSKRRAPLILFTDEPGKQAGANPQTFQAVCDTITKNKAEIKTAAAAKLNKPANDPDVSAVVDNAEAVCKGLLARKRP